MKQMIAHSLLAFLVAFGLFTPRAEAATDTLVALGATWKYLDDGTDQGTAWIAPSFNDTAWPSGPAQLGYGDGDEATVLSFGPDINNKRITYYFRRAFSVVNPGAYAIMTMRVRRDDGVILYLNGQEVFRDGLFDPVTYTTLAVNAGDDGQTLLVANIPPSFLVAGQNVIAAEIHQSGPGSTDISFDLELIASTDNNRPNVALLSPSEGAFFTEPATITFSAAANDSDGSVARVEFFQGNTKVGEDTTSPFAFDWLSVPLGNYALRAVAVDNLGARGTSAVVNVSVGVSTPPTLANKTPAPGNVSSLTSITVIFSEPVSGVTADDLLVNGVPAQSVTGSGTTYQFTIAPPSEGTVYVGWNGRHGIHDFENPPKAFDQFGTGATWQYTLTDNAAPTVVQLDPVAGASIRELDKIEVTFSEPVAGVDAADLRINGLAATSVSGFGAGPYKFQFPQPGNGAVNVTWAAAHGIRDQSVARNAFAGSSWSYTLNTNLVFENQVILSEIMYHPASELVADEWIELRNRGGTAVNLTGWRLNRAVEFVLPNVSIPAGGYLVVAANVSAFNSRYPGVANVVGGWTGRLSNSRDEIELEDASGNQVDLVEYADQGDWGVHIRGGLGWEWTSPADGSGSSMELRQAALPNDSGQNWLASTTAGGTPGQANSVATANLAPLILQVNHLPAVPRSTNNITILARIVDEATSGLTVRLWRRDVTAGLGNFVNVAMLDNGLSNDGSAGDGVFGVVLSPMANGTITEFYIEAVDSGGNARTWPAAGDISGGGGTLAQEANAFFQVDDENYSSPQAIYRIIMRPDDRNAFFTQVDRVQRNATFITIDGTDVQVRHNCTTRRRGASSFGSSPPTMKFDIPRDRTWQGTSSLNLNSVNTYSQVLGSALSLKAGLPTAYAGAVQVRFNGINYSSAGPGMFGSYAHLEVTDGDWARVHYPEDPNGNVYSKRRPECGLEYLGPDPSSYFNCGFDKESNASENDWTDLMNLTFALDPDTTPANEYVAAVRRNMNVDLWLRYFAVLCLMDYNETALSNGADDDYDLYRGLLDPRMIVLPHDFDSIFNTGGLPNDLFLGAIIPNMSRFLHHPEFEALYYEEFRRQLGGAFSTNNLFPLIDQILGGWVNASTIQSIKASAQARINFVTSALPSAPVVVRATVTGEPDSPTYLNAATLTVGGTDITQYRFRLNNGAWSADRLVSQPISLTGLANGHYTVYVVGRNSSGIWQADADATVSKTWAVLSSLRSVVINEVLARNDSAYNHEGTFPDYIELFNAGTTTVDLSGLRLTDDLDDPNRFTFPAGTTLAAGAYRVVYANNPDGTSGLHTGFGLSQDGDSVYLLDRATNGVRVLDSIEFGWQLSNLSIGRQASGQWGLCVPTHAGANTSSAIGPTATLKINEWLASPGAPFTEDFVEIYNPDSLPVNLGGLFMTDKPIGNPKRHAITPLSFVPGFGYRAFIADGNKSAGADHLDFALDQERGEIALVSTDGKIIDCVVYGAQFAGISQGRSPNGSARIVYLDVATPGAGNPFQGTVQPQLVNLIPLNGTYQWKYNDTGADLGTGWSATAYNDSTWPVGVALFGFDSNLVPAEPFRTQLVVTNNRITYYFRTHFTLPAGLNLSGLEATHITDDGAVFYINGIEAARFNMPPAPTPINNGTLASLSHEANVSETSSLNIAGLVVGDNVLAVEVHQNAATSADIVFGTRLDALVVTNNPATAGIKINEVLANARDATNSDGTITDWVELHNPSNGSVDLSGMSFTDQLANPRRWVFPAGSLIAPASYRVVRFNPDAPATTNSATVLNTGFGLKASGDSLYLFNRPQSGGELLDSISFGIQAADWSIGRVPNSSSNWVLNVPSAGGQNIAASLGNVALLRINEWMAAPVTGPDWFEIYNPNAQPVNVSGLYLTDDLNNRLQHPLPARSFMSAGLAGFLKIIADGDLAAGSDHVPFALAKGGDSLGISDPNGILIDQYTFGVQLTGVSQGRLPDGTANVISFPETPSPEESNYLPIPNVVINEVLTHSDPPFEDAIELRNTSGSPITITGWYLSDTRTALRKYRIGTVSIPANGFRVFYEYQFNFPLGDPNSFSLSSAKGDEVYLSATDAQGNLTGYRTKVDFGPSANAVSFGRYITSALNGNKVEFVSMAQRTFGVDNPPAVTDFRNGTGLPNSAPKVGPIVISEIMYHPPDLAGGVDNLNEEYIELQNITASSIPLFDPNAPTNHWRLRDAVSFDFPVNTTIPPNGVLLVVAFSPSDTTLLNAFKTRYNVQAGAIILGPYSGKLDNSSDSVELVMPDPPQTSGPDIGLVPYILIDKVKYFDTAPWPTTPDGGGQSLTRVTAANFGNDPVNWTGASPTPGPAAASQDTDGDGMPNAWETQYGLNPNVNDAAGDLDGDGARNLDEYLAGTAPNDPASVLRLTVVSSIPVVLRFNAAGNVDYTVEYKNSLGAGSWTTLQTVPAGNPRQVQVTDSSPGGTRFYRVRTP
jgi:hypothetical protein